MSQSDKVKKLGSQIALHEQLCIDLSRENNMEELKALAKEIGIPYSGKRKADLCEDIARDLQKTYAVMAYSDEGVYWD